MNKEELKKEQASLKKEMEGLHPPITCRPRTPEGKVREILKDMAVAYIRANKLGDADRITTAMMCLKEDDK